MLGLIVVFVSFFCPLMPCVRFAFLLLYSAPWCHVLVFCCCCYFSSWCHVPIRFDFFLYVVILPLSAMY